MEYLIIIAFQLLGIGFHVMQKVIELDKKFKEKSIKEVLLIFWEEDWNTLFVSTLILLSTLLIHYVIDQYAKSIADYEYYHLSSFAVSLTLGYAGQRLVYKWLGTAEQFLDKKVNDKIQ